LDVGQLQANGLELLLWDRSKATRPKKVEQLAYSTRYDVFPDETYEAIRSVLEEKVQFIGEPLRYHTLNEKIGDPSEATREYRIDEKGSDDL